jgi:very-short-patch-repair endonuclease
VHPGVFAVGHPRLTSSGRLLAAALSYGEPGTVGFRSASEHWGVLREARRKGPVEIIAPTGTVHRGTKLHRLTLPPTDRTTRDGVPVTTVGRTLADLATVAPRPLLAKAVNEAQVKQLLTSSQIRRAESASRHRPGGAQLRALLSKIDPGTRVRSGLERRFLELLATTTLPPPRVNALIEVEHTLHEVDFAWPDRRLAVEVDGAQVHGTPQAHRTDLERDARFTRAGWRVQRFSDVQVKDHPAEVTNTLAALLA